MRVAQYGLERISSCTASWVGLLREAGVWGTVDLNTLLKAPLSVLKDLKINGKTAQGEIYKTLGNGTMENAHRADGDVQGLMKIAQDRRVMKCLLTDTVALSLAAWEKHHLALVERYNYCVTMRAKWRRASVPNAPVTQAAPAAVAATSSAAGTSTAATPTTATAAVSLSETTARGRPKRNVQSTHMKQHGNERGVPLASLGSPWTRNKRNPP